METDLQGFHEDAQFSTNFLLSSDEMMKDQLKILESIKREDHSPWQDEIMMAETAVGKEDFHSIMSDWQNHVGSLDETEPEDIDVPLDILSSSDILFDEKRPVLSKTLQCSVEKLENVAEADLLGIKKEPSFDSDPCDSYLKINSEQMLYGGNIKVESSFDMDSCGFYPKKQNEKRNIKSELTVLRKLSLLNADKELLGRNIIGLHSLNEIKENPDQNCQVTSTVINGKRYKIIIKPKSQRIQKFNEEKIKKSLIKKLSKCTLLPKSEPKEDEIISEMRNGNYDVPILGSDTLMSWDMAWFGTTWDNLSDNNSCDIKIETTPEPPKKVPPLKIKLPKNRKCKKKKTEVRLNEEVDIEIVGNKVQEGEETGKIEERHEEVRSNVNEKKTHISNENIKKSLPKEMVNQIESLKRKGGRIPLVQVLPARKNLRSGTRMQDAAAAINRNKLLKIVSSGDTVQLDHDYCSNTFKNFEISQNKKVTTVSDNNLTEKNPKKDSGMESGDVSDASEDPQTPESLHSLQSIQKINNKLLEQKKNGTASAVTKVAAAFFRATNVIRANGTVNSSDVVKTMTVSNGNKALTNYSQESTPHFKAVGDKSDIVPSASSEICNSNNSSVKTDAEGEKSNITCSEQAQVTEAAVNQRPKKKLRLEEYLSRRNGKTDENQKDSPKSGNEADRPIDLPEAVETTISKTAKSKEEKEIEREKQETTEERKPEHTRRSRSKNKRSSRCRNKRSSSSSSGEKDDRKNRERGSRSRSSWRGSRRDSRSRHRHRSSTSSERRRSFWSRSLSRSSSRESSSSSDRSGSRKKRRISPVWCHRRSRSRSISRERSRSRNRSYSNRRRQNHNFNRNFYGRRSGSPYRNHIMREKQRQIEERRVIYIGRIEEGMTNAKLRERFSVFGPIVDISLHFREYGDNYGFVTYAYKDDAYDAVEHGNDDPSLPRYDLCFGGRRGFCKERYADLDGMPTSYSGFNETPILRSEESFDLLLKKAQAKLKNRISRSGNT